MDTHIAEPTLDDISTYQARLPGEPGQGRVPGGDAPLHAGERTTPAAPRAKRKSGLLSGVAIIAVVVIAGGGFLISPYNTIVPVPPAMKLAGLHVFGRAMDPPKQARAVASNTPSPTLSPHVALDVPPPHPARPQRAAAQAAANPDLLAPSAVLASAKPPAPPSPVVQLPYQPKPTQDEVAELEGLQSVSKSPLRSTPNTMPPEPVPAGAPKHPIVATPAHPVEPPKPTQVAAEADGPPAGYVPHEPGAVVPTTALVAQPSSNEAAKPPATAQTAAVVPVAAKAPAAAPTRPAAPQQVSVTPSEALAVAPKLEAAPLSPPEQVQVLELVTQLATLIRDERTQISNLQADEQSGNKATAAKLGDMERRLALVEASSAVASASNVPASSAQAAAPTPGTSTSVALLTAKAALTAAGKQAPIQPIVTVPTPPPAPVSPQQYHVQAASPGLAMLTTVDRSGGDGAQIQVQVGDMLPGYGHVLSVSQKGTSWVVKTDNGLIQ